MGRMKLSHYDLFVYKQAFCYSKISKAFYTKIQLNAEQKIFKCRWTEKGCRHLKCFGIAQIEQNAFGFNYCL